MLLNSFLILILINVCYSYPSGAPLDRCESMFPGHNVDPLTDAPPFAISINPMSDSQSFNGD